MAAIFVRAKAPPPIAAYFGPELHLLSTALSASSAVLIQLEIDPGFNGSRNGTVSCNRYLSAVTITRDHVFPEEFDGEKPDCTFC